MFETPEENYPESVVETPLGFVRLVGWSGTNLLVTFVPDTPPITVNRVPLDVRMEFQVDEGKIKLKYDSTRKRDAKDWKNDRPSGKTAHKTQSLILPAIQEFIGKNPEFLRKSEMAELWRQKREVDKEIQKAEEELKKLRDRAESLEQIMKKVG